MKKKSNKKPSSKTKKTDVELVRDEKGRFIKGNNEGTSGGRKRKIENAEQLEKYYIEFYNYIEKNHYLRFPTDRVFLAWIAYKYHIDYNYSSFIRAKNKLMEDNKFIHEMLLGDITTEGVALFHYQPTGTKFYQQNRAGMKDYRDKLSEDRFEHDKSKEW